MPAAKLLMTVPLALFSVSCATHSPGGESSGGAYYHDAAFNDRNPAPASLSPPSQDPSTAIDQLHMRTQADYHFAMGEAHSFEGRRQQAVESFKMTLVYDPDSVAVRRRLAGEYLRMGFVSEAIDQAQAALEKDPRDIESHLLLGGLFSATKNYEKALAHYEAVLKIDPKHLEAPLFMGAVWSEQKKFEKAAKAFENLAKNPDYPSPHLAWYYVGRVRLEQKESKYQKEAEKAFERALVIRADHLDSALALGALYSRRKQEDKAVTFLRSFQKEQGPHPRIAEVLAQHYLESGDYDGAYEQLEVLERSGEDPLSAKLKMALILIDKKMFNEATVRLEEIIAEAPESDKVRFYLAAVYEETKKDDKAILHFRQIPQESPYFEEAVVHAAYLLKGKNRVDEALTVVEGALKAGKEQPQIYAMYASLLDERGRFQEAAVSLEGALQKHPDNAQLRFYYGTIQDRLGNKPGVIQEMRKVIELDPNHVQGLNYLAYTWAEEGANLDEAESLARRATELEPEDGYILDTLGWILFKRGEVAEAIRYLEAAYRFQPTVPVIAEHLGDAYLKVAMVERAIEMYNRAIRLETDGKRIEELRSKISSLGDPAVPIQVRSPASTAGADREREP